MKTVFGLLLGAVLLLGGYTWLALHWSYSTGERAGYVQKFSRKGWICKTWEGEMALISMPGTVAEKFFFSVRDDAMAARINQSVGRRVRLLYDQHIGVPTSCFGETQYFVDDIKTVDEGGFEAQPPAAGKQGETAAPR
jgi:hypothetical protein